jgi:hypothetical protein
MKTIDLHFDFEYFGAAVIEFEIDNQHYKFESTYMGENPLNALITALWQLSVASERVFVDENGEEITNDIQVSNFIWQNEPWGHSVKLSKRKNELRITIMYFSDTERYSDNLYSFEDLEVVLDVTTDFDDFTKRVCREAIKTLRKYGFVGYYRSWDDSAKHNDFPIEKLLYLLGTDCKNDNDLYFSNFEKEITLLKI